MAKRTFNKSAFVREMGRMPAAEIVKRAKQRGIDLSVGYVYNIRGAANRKSRRAPHTVRGSRPSGGSLRASIDRLASQLVEQILRAIRGAALADVLRI